MLLFPLISLLAITINVHAKADLEKFFTGGGDIGGVRKYWPNRNNDNGCRNHVVDLETSYEEAAKLIDAAVAAIAMIKKEKPKLFGRKDWSRMSKTMTSMFGIEMSTKGGPAAGKDNVDGFNYVEGIFNQMKEGMDDDKAQSAPGPYRAPRNPGLFCGTNGWRYYAPHDNDPGVPGKLISDQIGRNGPKYPNGVWYFHYQYLVTEDTTPTSTNLCPPGVQALTLPQLNIITWCDYAWSSLAKKIDPKEVKWLAKLDKESRNSLSSIWVHELAHFYGMYNVEEKDRLIDKPAVAWDGTPQIRPNGSPVKTYGAGYVINLAHQGKFEATHTADAYSMFAVAMYLSDWDWSKGVAKR